MKDKNYLDFIQLSGPIFEEVQKSKILKDSMTFVDSYPLKSPFEILKKYFDNPNNITEILNNFNIPEEPVLNSGNIKYSTPEEYISNTWNKLAKYTPYTENYSTFIPLPYPYIIPGGRFRCIYYWDSFFTVLGLIQDREYEMAINMCKNFAYLIETIGFIPNGNRLYLSTRSQPPVFSMIIDLIHPYIDIALFKYLVRCAELEYMFWMKGSQKLASGESEKRVVNYKGNTLNRYYDNYPKPRQESFGEDLLNAEKLPANKRTKFYLDIRAGAESGWDFSSRWFLDTDILSISTTDILPIDLNCLIYNIENKLSYWFEIFNNKKSEKYSALANSRKKVINDLFWSEKEGFYFDINHIKDSFTYKYTLASLFPMYFQISTKEMASEIAKKIEREFVFDGGVVTTVYPSHEQWDYPNGWAPLQWITIRALQNYGYFELADQIRQKWIILCEKHFLQKGSMFEKYDVVNIDKFASGGEYILQEGFGWTNGVYLDLKYKPLYINGR